MKIFYNKSNNPLKNYLDWIAALAILAIAISALSTQSHIFPFQDYIQYWTAGYLNLHQGNPYDPQQMLSLERTIGYLTTDPLMMFNPPWVLTFSMLMALLPYSVSRSAFFVFSLIIFLVCARLGWSQYKGEHRLTWIPYLSVFTFYGVLHLLKGGQISVLVVLGVCLFIYYWGRGRDFLAGFFIPLMLIKPHLIYLFLVADIFWILKSRRWKVMAGMLSGFFVLTIIPLLANPPVFFQYYQLAVSSPFNTWATATLATPIRQMFEGELFWIQFVPSILGFLWFVWYWVRNQHQWDWRDVSPLIILVSMATSSYGWIIDHAVVYLAIIQVLSRLLDNRHWKWYLWIVIIAYVTLDIYVIIINRPQHELWWVSTGMLVIYLLFSRILNLRANSLALKDTNLT